MAQVTRDDNQGARSGQWPLAASRQGCWPPPPSQTVEEALKVAANPTVEVRLRVAARNGADRDVLLLSDGTLKAAYAAGLILGWGETGNRPRFAAISAVGMSALVAPFAFIGPAGDQIIADIFNCPLDNLTGMAERAVSYLDDGVLEAIAREHDAGRRLLVALTGSPARAEAVWDIGRLAASRHPKAAALVRQVLLASVDAHAFVDPRNAPIKAGKVVARNFTFRTLGAGAQFLFPSEVAQISGRDARYYLIHNAGVFPDESAEYVRARTSKDDDLHADAQTIMPAYDIVRHSLATNGRFRFASIKLGLGLTQQAPFDMAYVRALFLYAYRQGRMGKEWKSTFPGLTNVVAKSRR
jgi:predicted RecA/RadA family phage recombinase